MCKQLESFCWSLALLATAAVSFFSINQLAMGSTWNMAASGDFDVAGNWTGGVPDGSTSIADFSTLDLNGDVSVTLNTPKTLGQLLFGDTGLGTAGSWELRTDQLATAIITLDNGASKPIIGVNELTPTTFDDAFIAPSLAGTNGFRKTGAGIATLGQGTTNTVTGGIDIEEGTLRVRAAIPSQAVTIANGATLDTTVDMRFAAGINVASGATVNIIANSNVGNLNASGATLNVIAPAAGDTVSANDNWGLNGSPAVVNVSAPLGGFFRLRPNGGGFNGALSFATSAVNLDNITMWNRTNSGGNTTNLGSLSGNATAILSGGGQGGGSFATYSIGALNTNTTFAGNIDTTSAPTPNSTTDLGGLNLTKVGTGTLTLSGTLSYQPTGNGTINRRGGITTVSAGTLALTNSAAVPGGIVHATVGDVLSTINVQTDATLDVSGFSGSYSTAALQQVVGAGTIAGNYTHDEGLIRPANTLNGTTASGASPSVAVGGTINFANNFTWSGGSVTFDMTDNPAAGNDLISVGGATTLTSGTVSPNFLGALPSAGTYTVLTSAGGISGPAANITIDWPGRGADPVPFLSGNSLQFIATDINAGGTMTWVGNDATNPTFWDVETTPNWTGAIPNTFFQSDIVRFDDTATSFNVAIQETVMPTAIVFENVTNAYTVTGTSGISGAASLTKTGAGNLTITTPNTFVGTATLSGGATVEIGGATSALGNGPLVMNGITVLASTGQSSLGNSTLTVSGTNTIQANGNLGSGNITNIPNLSGTGTLTISSTVGDPVTDPPSGNGKWFSLNSTGGFTGTLNLTGPTTTPGAPVQGLTVRTTSSGGGTLLAGAVVNMSNTSMANRQGGSGTVTFTLGELHGDADSFLRGFTGGSAGRQNVIWEIGALNTDSDYAGAITDPGGTSTTSGVFAWQDRTNDSTVNPVLEQIAISHLRKLGSGTLTISGLTGITGTNFSPDGTTQVISDTYSGNTMVEGGTLSIDTPYLADFSDVLISGGATLDLDFGSLSTIDTIDSLFFDGVSQVTGTWGRIGSGAAHESTFFTGDGLLMVSTLQMLAGDFDGDGDVDGRDFLVWQRGGSPTPLSAADLATWQTNFGTGALQAVSSVGAVPEPGSLVLVACGLAVLALRKRG